MERVRVFPPIIMSDRRARALRLHPSRVSRSGVAQKSSELGGLIVVNPSMEGIPISSCSAPRLRRSLRSEQSGLSSVRCLNQDLQAAREIQSRFLPGCLPHISGLDYGGDCQPAGDAGGDFFDLRRLPGNELAVSVGDVSGHGIDAAILLSVIQAFLRGLTGTGSVEVLKVIEELNQVVCQVAPAGICATLFLAYVDPRRRELRYVSQHLRGNRPGDESQSLAKCEIRDGGKPKPRWREDPGLMAFLRSL